MESARILSFQNKMSRSAFIHEKGESMKNCPICYRRDFLAKATAGAAAFFTVPGAFAEDLMRTPAQGEGPFYPDKLPLDTDNDLVVINDSITPAIGEISHLTGKVTDVKGNPIRNAVVKIWQTLGIKPAQ